MMFPGIKLRNEREERKSRESHLERFHQRSDRENRTYVIRRNVISRLYFGEIYLAGAEEDSNRFRVPDDFYYEIRNIRECIS